MQRLSSYKSDHVITVRSSVYLYFDLLSREKKCVRVCFYVCIIFFFLKSCFFYVTSFFANTP